jgi:hypothetical protein
MHLFTALKLGLSFLSSDPDMWDSREDYQQAKEIVAAVRVVYDCAERAVKLATDFNLQPTKDEEQH